MRKLILPLFILFLSILSCGVSKSLKSTTYIKANEAFILGNNEHGKFTTHVTNTSNVDITIWQYPINGGRHSPVTLNSHSRTKVNVDRNTALRIENKSSDQIAVKLKVKGDVGLSMGYQN